MNVLITGGAGYIGIELAYHSFFVVASLIFYYFILSNKLIMYNSNSDYF